MQKIFNYLFSLVIIISSIPILLLFAGLIFFSDFKSPIYVSYRVGKNHKLFKIYKLRSMFVDADKKGNSFSSNNDNRITSIGKIIRKYKIDELTQFINVLFGDMNIVGPRPNVKEEVDLYSDQDKKLLTVKPGITDFASIMFSNEAGMLSNKKDKSKFYHTNILPWKNKFSLFYIDHSSFMLDLELIFYTIISIFSKICSFNLLYRKLNKLGANQELLDYFNTYILNKDK